METRDGTVRRTAYYVVRTACVATLLLGCDNAESRTAATPSAASSSHDSLRARADLARVAGDSGADLWLVVASDFQCPYCAQWHRDTYRALRDEYVRTGKIRMAYLHFPLEQHRHALPAAVATMCAGAQGKFWPVHDAIFDAQAQWAPLPDARATFAAMAARAGVDTTQWNRCVAERVMESLIQADSERAQSAGVASTPTFVISPARPPARRGHIIRGAAPIAEFRHVLDAMIAAGSAR